jgi:hypothetical protein
LTVVLLGEMYFAFEKGYLRSLNKLRRSSEYGLAIRTLKTNISQTRTVIFIQSHAHSIGGSNVTFFS